MTTVAKIVANRLNALASTGPRTPEGKAKAAQNARKHGLFSQAAVLPDEDLDEYNRLNSQIRSEHCSSVLELYPSRTSVDQT